MLPPDVPQMDVAAKDEPSYSFMVDEKDPVAHWLRVRLGWDWPQVLIAAFLIYGPLEKLIIPGFGNYLTLGTDIGKWSPDIVAMLTGFVVYPLIWAFYLWTSSGIGNLFVSLGQNKSFTDANSYQDFMVRAQAAFCRRRWSILSLGISIFITLLVHFVLWGPSSEFTVWFGQNNTLHRLFALALVGLVGYAAGQIVIRQTLAIVWLLRLLRGLGNKLEIHPYHTDGAGGLGAVGQYAVRFSLLLLVVMIYFVGGSVLPSLQAGEKLALSLRNPALILAWAFYVVIVPGTFISLLWPAHLSMTTARNGQLNVIAAQLDEQLKAARNSVTSDRSQLSAVLKEIENLKSTRTLILQDYPIWPVSTEIRRQISASVAVPPIAHLLITLALNIFSP